MVKSPACLSHIRRWLGNLDESVIILLQGLDGLAFLLGEVRRGWSGFGEAPSTLVLAVSATLHCCGLLVPWKGQGQDRSIIATVYRKSTHTDKCLDFTSHHPIAHQIVVVRTLHSRAETISSSLPPRDKETDVIKHHSRTTNCPGPADQQEARGQSATIHARCL